MYIQGRWIRASKGSWLVVLSLMVVVIMACQRFPSGKECLFLSN